MYVLYVNACAYVCMYVCMCVYMNWELLSWLRHVRRIYCSQILETWIRRIFKIHVFKLALENSIPCMYVCMYIRTYVCTVCTLWVWSSPQSLHPVHVVKWFFAVCSADGCAQAWNGVCVLPYLETMRKTSPSKHCRGSHWVSNRSGATDIGSLY